jgi:hypothetical protein
MVQHPNPHQLLLSYVANAKIDDLEPSQMVAAIIAVEDAIRATYPRMHRSGWSATSDGLRIHFHQWTPITTREWVEANT